MCSEANVLILLIFLVVILEDDLHMLTDSKKKKDLRDRHGGRTWKLDVPREGLRKVTTHSRSLKREGGGEIALERA